MTRGSHVVILYGIQTKQIYFRMGTTNGLFQQSLIKISKCVNSMKNSKIYLIEPLIIPFLWTYELILVSNTSKAALAHVRISIFSNGSHLGWSWELSDIIYNGNHQRTLPAKFGSCWYSSFWGDDWKVEEGRKMPSDDTSFPWLLVRWAKNYFQNLYACTFWS